LFDLLEKRTADVEELMRSVKGFVGYTLARSDEGGFSVTVCLDKAGIDESVQKAKDWIREKRRKHGRGRAGGIGGISPHSPEGTLPRDDWQRASSASSASRAHFLSSLLF
jgi:hypothetical protein